jgi:dTDP-4-amino-4,6-dideoxygalactose transaminase
VSALLALGIGAGHEVVTTPFSFFASVEAVLRAGARPRFADISPETFALDPDAVDAAIGPNTRAILLVHLYGQPAATERLRTLAEQRGVALIEDCAQAFGARGDGRAAGTAGVFGCFSFQPTKPLGAWGDAGLVVTHDRSLAERCRRLRAHGALAKHRHAEVGGNYRMDAVQALVLARKLPLLDGWLELRRKHAEAYERALASESGIVTPRPIPGTQSSRALYTIRVRDGRRDALREFLALGRIETAVHYPLALHRQPALLSRGHGADEGAFPEAERAAREVLSLPLYPELSDARRERVVSAIAEFFSKSLSQ